MQRFVSKTSLKRSKR